MVVRIHLKIGRTLSFLDAVDYRKVKGYLLINRTNKRFTCIDLSEIEFIEEA